MENLQQTDLGNLGLGTAKLQRALIGTALQNDICLLGTPSGVRMLSFD